MKQGDFNIALSLRVASGKLGRNFQLKDGSYYLDL